VLSAALVFFFQKINQKVLDSKLGFVAGAMIFVVVEELIPKAHLKANADTVSIAN